MKILSMTATFGKLDHETLTLKPGMNVISAPNEWGKSTWCAFLLAMLYGIDTGARAAKGSLPDKTRYAPWSGKPMSGRMEILWQDRAITLERSTRGRVPMGKFSAYETESGLPVPELTAANCGQMLLGAERSVFTRSGFLRFSDLPVTADEKLMARLQALVTTGDESGAGELLEKKLTALKNSCQYHKKGRLPEAMAQWDALQQTLQQQQALLDREKSLSRQAEELQQDEALLANHLQWLEYDRCRRQEQARNQAELRWQQARDRADALQTRCRDLPDGLESRIARLHTIQQARLEAMQETRPAPEISPEQAGADARRWKQLQNPPRRPPLLWIAGALFLLAAAGFLLAKLWIAGAMAGGGGLCLLAAALMGSHRDRQQADRVRSEKQQLQDRYGDLPPEQWAAHARKLASVYESRVQTRKELEQQLLQLTGGLDPAQAQAQWQNGLQLRRELLAAQNEADAYQDSLQALGPAGELPPAPADQDPLDLTEPETRQALAQCREQLQTALTQAGTLRGQAQSLGAPQVLRENLKNAEQKVAALTAYSQAISLALDRLEEASRQLQRRFAPQITRHTRDLLEELTGGRYDKLRLSDDFSLEIGTREDVTLHPVQYPSDGTVDQLYLALRLAVARVLMPEAPLILDDALIRFDDQRLQLAMSVLRREARDRQVIVFTCQGREK